MLRGQAAGNFADKVDRGNLGALQIAAQLAFNQRVATHHARAAAVSFGSEIKIPAGANASAEAGRDFVIAQIDVRAATRTICRGSCVTDFLFSLALKTRDSPDPLPVPKAFDSAKTSWR